MVKRWSSLAGEPFEERLGECRWELVWLFPFRFFQHSVGSLDGKTMKGISTSVVTNSRLPLPFLESYQGWNAPCSNCPAFFRHLCLLNKSLGVLVESFAVSITSIGLTIAELCVFYTFALPKL